MQDDEVERIISCIDCYSLRSFLLEQLKVDDNLKDEFLKNFRTNRRVNVRYYKDKLETIFNKGKGREYAMHGYYDLDYIGSSLLRFFDEDISHIISLDEYAVACDLLNHTMEYLDDDMYMNFDVYFNLAYKYNEYASVILESGKLDESQKYEMESKYRKFRDYV